MLQPRGDCPFQVLEKINDNAYKLDLPSECQVSPTFNASNLSPFDWSTNHYEKWGKDIDLQPEQDYMKKTSRDIHESSGPIKRARAKHIQDSLT